MSVEWTALVVLTLFVMFGGVVQGALGFGFGLVVLPAAALIVAESVPQVLLMLTLPTVLIIWWHERAHVGWDDLSWVLSGRVLGTVPGVALILILSTRSLQILFAVVTLGAVATMSIGRVRLPVHRRSQFSAGLLSGTMATATSLGGPPLALLYARRPASQLRGMMAASLLGGNVFSLGGLIVAGRVSRFDLLLTLGMAIPLSAGMLVGTRVLKLISPEVLRLVVYLVIAVSAGVLLASALLG